MRWGVRDDAQDDHLTTKIVLREVENAQRLSYGPNFVVCDICINFHKILGTCTAPSMLKAVWSTYDIDELTVIAAVALRQALLGNRYGSRSFPSEIEATEFNILIDAAFTISKDYKLLKTWYISFCCFS